MRITAAVNGEENKMPLTGDAKKVIKKMQDEYGSKKRQERLLCYSKQTKPERAYVSQAI